MSTEVATAPHQLARLDQEKSSSSSNGVSSLSSPYSNHLHNAAAPAPSSSSTSRSNTSPSKSAAAKVSTSAAPVPATSLSTTSNSTARISPSNAPTAAASDPVITSRLDDTPASPNSKRNEIPKIIVKKEPTSPDPPPPTATSRRRPPPAKLHLNDNDTNDSGNPVPRTAGGNLATMRDVGMACLSPGFATQDPSMREQLQRSISVRDQQRSIIEARLHRGPKTGGLGKDNDGSSRSSGGGPTPKRRPPPNGLSIVPPSHKAFANERIIQSAPLHQTFTGRHQPHPAVRHPPPQHTSTHHNPANRLPPIADVFASDRLDRRGPIDPPPSSTRNQHAYYPQRGPGQPSPGQPSASFNRPRESRSAEEALQALAGGRDDLLPRIIHYGGHQPPTPPSPPQNPPLTGNPKLASMNGTFDAPPPSAGRRRGRAEFEEDVQFGIEDGRRESPESKRRKKEEFMSLCARAWDLFHS